MPDELILRDVTERDLAILFHYQRDPEAIYMAAFVPRDRSDWEVFVNHWKRILADPTVIMKAILWRGQVAGSVGSFEREGKTQVGYWIGKEHWGKGIATWALREFLLHETRRPLYAGAASDNIASIRVLQKCGFTVCAHTRGFADARGAEIEEVILELQV